MIGDRAVSRRQACRYCPAVSTFGSRVVPRAPNVSLLVAIVREAGRLLAPVPGESVRPSSGGSGGSLPGATAEPGRLALA
jgi:hypothetical protein